MGQGEQLAGIDQRALVGLELAIAVQLIEGGLNGGFRGATPSHEADGFFAIEAAITDRGGDGLPFGAMQGPQVPGGVGELGAQRLFDHAFGLKTATPFDFDLADFVKRAGRGKASFAINDRVVGDRALGRLLFLEDGSKRTKTSEASVATEHAEAD